ncbi:GNAT family N-acetyltransferase [Marinomonas sp. TW1]|uniref:GNAT family N-acetyltransferase n=1 Tax=Marinomonas sp. TW1 TaxID=1561203 RepID=UPI0007AF1485|nr:GNAT family N-acetyltransferase [Marinomonas sp. TW1]KZN12501.1 acetyltransferase [Marinomonas sp. TW1]
MLPPFPNAELVPSLWFPLVKKFYQAHYPSGKPNKADPIWAIKENGAILAVARLKQIDNHQLLTGMVTTPNKRNTGIGQHLLSNLQPILKQKSSYCFALDHLTHFYQRAHFQVINENDLPDTLRTRFRSYRSQGRNITPMQYFSP